MVGSRFTCDTLAGSVCSEPFTTSETRQVPRSVARSLARLSSVKKASRKSSPSAASALSFASSASFSAGSIPCHSASRSTRADRTSGDCQVAVAKATSSSTS
jgi:hypothetical protein